MTRPLILCLLLCGCAPQSYNEWVRERCWTVCSSVAVTLEGRNVCFCKEFYK